MIIFSFARFPERGLAFVGGAAQSTALWEPAEVSLPAGKYACCLVRQNLQRAHSLFPGSGAPGQDNVADLDAPLKFSTYQRCHRMGPGESLGFHSTLQGISGKGRVRPMGRCTCA